ncbi:hypothetical protein PMIT1342_00555 [Prochlorococcus marinus str. MIT 1342]|nr:hypothetical protein [Prochlorococcus marinus]KZR82904.1 hypothetical protein PMIT1342_00555 [Prochlorococcus marinus str. MIT 1342]
MALTQFSKDKFGKEAVEKTTSAIYLKNNKKEQLTLDIITLAQ